MNLAVLAQAAVIALLVLRCRSFAPGRVRSAREAGCCARSIYFPALGLGFLFIEIFLIERASLYLNDRTSGVRPGADRDADLLRPRQPAGRPL